MPRHITNQLDHEKIADVFWHINEERFPDKSELTKISAQINQYFACIPLSGVTSKSKISLNSNAEYKFTSYNSLTKDSLTLRPKSINDIQDIYFVPIHFFTFLIIIICFVALPESAEKIYNNETLPYDENITDKILSVAKVTTDKSECVIYIVIDGVTLFIELLVYFVQIYIYYYVIPKLVEEFNDSDPISNEFIEDLARTYRICPWPHLERIKLTYSICIGHNVHNEILMEQLSYSQIANGELIIGNNSSDISIKPSTIMSQLTQINNHLSTSLNDISNLILKNQSRYQGILQSIANENAVFNQIMLNFTNLMFTNTNLYNVHRTIYDYNLRLQDQFQYLQRFNQPVRKYFPYICFLIQKLQTLTEIVTSYYNDYLNYTQQIYFYKNEGDLTVDIIGFIPIKGWQITLLSQALNDFIHGNRRFTIEDLKKLRNDLNILERELTNFNKMYLKRLDHLSSLEKFNRVNLIPLGEYIVHFFSNLMIEFAQFAAIDIFSDYTLLDLPNPVIPMAPRYNQTQAAIRRMTTILNDCQQAIFPEISELIKENIGLFNQIKYFQTNFENQLILFKKQFQEIFSILNSTGINKQILVAFNNTESFINSIPPANYLFTGNVFDCGVNYRLIDYELTMKIKQLQELENQLTEKIGSLMFATQLNQDLVNFTNSIVFPNHVTDFRLMINELILKKAFLQNHFLSEPNYKTYIDISNQRHISIQKLKTKVSSLFPYPQPPVNVDTEYYASLNLDNFISRTKVMIRVFDRNFDHLIH